MLGLVVKNKALFSPFWLLVLVPVLVRVLVRVLVPVRVPSGFWVWLYLCCENGVWWCA